MGKINEETRKFVSLCADCNHNEVSHMKATFRDEQRQTMTSTRASPSECQECKKQGKSCKQFRPSN